MSLPGDNFILEYKELPKYPNEIGMKFGYLEVLHEIECDDIPGVVYELRCKCGKEVLRHRYALMQQWRKNKPQSCGCYFKSVIAKYSKFGVVSYKNGRHDRLYGIWSKMKYRCHNPKSNKYKNYGARGIGVCKKWIDDFEAFYNWAMKNGYKKHLTIDRKNNDKGYSPDNCRWITRKDQSRNMRKNSRFLINGEWILQIDLAERLGVSWSTVRNMALDGRLKYEYWNKDPSNK